MLEGLLLAAGIGLGAGAAALAAALLGRRARIRRAAGLSRLAHDLRAPLSSIAAYAELLQDGAAEAPAERDRFLRIIQEETARMDRMIGERLAPPAERPPAPGPDPAGPARGTVLVVDDDRFIRDATARLLAREGYETLEASGGEEALRRARERLPDLILMDLRMPDLDGTEAVRRLQADPATRGIPVILTTGDGGAAAPEGARVVLTKPIPAQSLLRAVAREIA